MQLQAYYGATPNSMRSRHTISYILYHQSSQHEAKDGSDVGNGSVASVVGVNGFLVLKQLVGIDALELAFGELLVALEAVAEGTSQGVTLHLPELSNLDACRVKFQGCTHRREEFCLCLAGQDDEGRLVF